MLQVTQAYKITLDGVVVAVQWKSKNDGILATIKSVVLLKTSHSQFSVGW